MLINAGKAGDAEVLIDDAGRYVLRSAGQEVTADGAALRALLDRTRPVSVLVASSKSPIERISAPVERALARFGCSVQRDSEPAS